MKNFIVNVSAKTSKIYLEETSVAVDGENIAGQVIFKFNDDEFIDGMARLEWQNGSDKYFQLMEKVGKTYVLPIKNVMTKEGKMYFQLVITKEQVGEDIPVFKSNEFYVYVEKSINAEGEAPSGYDTWLDYANAKLIEMDNLNITASKSGNTETITLTDKQGNEHKTYIYDGQNGRDGVDGKDAKINGYNTVNIVAGENITIDQEGSTLTINGEAGGSGLVNDVTVNGTSVVENKVAKVVVPTKVSDLSNDSGFITNTVNNLTNYYLKSETYTKSEVNTLIGNIEKVTLQVVQELPTTGESNVIYLVPKTGSTGDVYDEYIYVNNNWEHIGSTEVDLSNYYTKTETDTLLSGKQATLTAGENISISNNVISAITIPVISKKITYTQSDFDILDKVINGNVGKYAMICMLSIAQDMYPNIITDYITTNGISYTFRPKYALPYDNYNSIELVVKGAWNNGVFTTTEIQNQSSSSYNRTLLIDNTKSYTPTANYHPATKKYVDTAVAGVSVGIDNSSITKNASDNLQAVGVIDSNSGNTDKMWTGTLQQYNAIQNKDADTYYYITDDETISNLREKVEVITSSDTSYTIDNLTGNKAYKLGELTALTITACDVFDEETIIYFSSGTTATTLSLPNDVVAIGDTTINASKNYIISVLNKIAAIKEY